MRYYLFIIVFGMMLLLGSVASAEKIICDFCKEEIKTQYIEVDGKFYHPIHFRCDECGTVIGFGSYFRKDGKHYCEKCYDKLFGKTCALCCKPITDEYVIHEGKEYHKECYDSAFSVKCTICNRKIEGKYFVNFWGDKYCASHQDEYPACYYCGRLITGSNELKLADYGDGRMVCQICRHNAVKSDGYAQKLFDEALGRLANAGIRINRDNISLHLTDKKTLNDLDMNNQADRDGLVLYNKMMLGNKIIELNYDIYLTNGMPRADFMLAAAHELMHVWVFENSDLDHDKPLLEGSCNYAAFLVIRQLTGDQIRYTIETMEQDKNPVYGEGFRRVRKLVDEKGMGFWLDWLKNNSEFPPSY